MPARLYPVLPPSANPGSLRAAPPIGSAPGASCLPPANTRYSAVAAGSPHHRRSLYALLERARPDHGLATLGSISHAAAPEQQGNGGAVFAAEGLDEQPHRFHDRRGSVTRRNCYQQIELYVSCWGMLDADDIGWVVTAIVAVLVYGIVAFTAAKWLRR